MGVATLVSVVSVSVVGQVARSLTPITQGYH